MAITRETVEHVARLARLSLGEEEAEQFTGQLGNILAYVEKIRDLDTENVEPLTYPVPMKAMMRDDIVEPSLLQEEALAGAPEIQDGMFKVPRIIEEE